MLKQRFYTIPSSIGSYFGVGYLTPEEQLEIDLGIEEREIDNASRDRMELGKKLENATLDFFEDKLGIIITDRNEETLWFYDDKIKGKIDGMTTYNGERTVVECKISNASTGRFTEEINYIMQVQCYMLATETNQALLCGLYQGKPIFEVIYRDEEMINDIKEMTDFIFEVLGGIESFSNYPEHLKKKYSKTTDLVEIHKLPEELSNDAKLLLVYKEQFKDLEKKIKTIEDKFKNKFSSGTYETNLYKLSISTIQKKPKFDLDAFKLEHPNLDYNYFSEAPIPYKRFTFRIKK